VKPQQTVVVMLTKEHVFVQGEPNATIAEVLNAKTELVEARSCLRRAGAVVFRV
jgi:hypothetical protein